MKNFVSNRNIVLRSSKSGHAIRFIKGEPTPIPRSMYDEAMAIGILPVEGDEAEVQKAVEPGAVMLAPQDADERADKILEVMEAMVKRNSSADFTGGAEPSAKSISAVLHWKVDQAEVRKIWKKNRERLHATREEAAAA